MGKVKEQMLEGLQPYDQEFVVAPTSIVGDITSKVGAVKFDSGKPQMELLSPVAIEELAKVLTFGAKKYAARNWEKGMAYRRVIAAVLRHTFSYLSGETKDPETGLSHMAHAMCECMFLVHFELTKTGTDDRV